MSEQVHDLGSALAGEFGAIHGPDEAVTDEASFRKRAVEIGQSALCLSGGGIRSAAFSLGVVQALARISLLAQFDYLSTVSGGGFIGAWLSALIREKHGAAAAETELRENEAAPAIQALREYTNYLMPTGGLLSDDTWSDFVLYLRNLLINWLAFAPMFLLMVLVAIFYRTVLWRVGESKPVRIALLAIGVILVVIATLRACIDLPSHRPLQPSPGEQRFVSPTTVNHWIVWPLLIWAFLVPGTLSGWLEHDNSGALSAELWLPAIYAGAMMIGYWGAAFRGRAAWLYSANFGGWLIATLFSAGFIWVGLRLAGTVPAEDQAEALAVAGPLWLILANVLQSTIHVAVRREALLGDLDREWLARLSAVKLKVVVIWALFAFCCLSLQRVAFHAAGAAGPFWAVPIVTFVSGPTAAWLGKQVFTQAQTALASPDRLARLTGRALPLLSLVFAIGLFTVLGYLVGEWLGAIQLRISKCDRNVPILVQLAAMLVLLLLMWRLVKRINVNRFSMHGVYRNRLTRAFLGAVRPNRKPDPFTRFDPADNPRMVELAQGPGPRALFHVINVALNLTATTRTAWAERKAAAFTITPLACGSPALRMPHARATDPAGCYVPTRVYAGQEHETGEVHESAGMSLASAMTISGAAVSPNWGYHSSPITAFLMTLFNVRLGAWLPNPAVVTESAELQLAWPHTAFLPMLDDLLGRTTDSTKAIYLSDGGHFDNLGLYEMLRRRCRLILVVDAGQDFACDFQDLGNAIRKAAIDQQIHVSFSERIRICSRGKPGRNALAFAVATITYPEGSPDGKLLYLKPSYLDDLPVDVRAYGAAHPQFPHESTLAQWFTESQFESYRRLGEHQMEMLCRLTKAGDGLAALFTAAEEGARPPVSAGGCNPSPGGFA